MVQANSRRRYPYDQETPTGDAPIALSIVIVTWNGRRYVEECLVSLERQSPRLSTQIIVVDNASWDGTPEWIYDRFPTVTLVRNQENVGFARANNIGISLAKGQYICLINSDVIVPPDCLYKMILFMEANPLVGMIGPRMHSPDGRVCRSYMRFPTLWNWCCYSAGLERVPKAGRIFGDLLMKRFDATKTAEVEVLNGWFLMVKRTGIDHVGLLDESFFMYGEDIDWSRRFYERGWKRVYFADAYALHYGGGSSAIAPVRFYIEMQRAHLRYWEKHAGAWEKRAFWGILLTHHVSRVIAYGLLYIVNKQARKDLWLKIRRSAAAIYLLFEVTCQYRML